MLRYLTFDRDRFPDPARMLRHVARTGRRMVCSVDPHLKEDDAYFMYAEAQQRGYFVTDRDGKQYKGFCWPGTGCFVQIDFPHNSTRLGPMLVTLSWSSCVVSNKGKLPVRLVGAYTCGDW